MNSIDFDKLIAGLGEAMGMKLAFDEDGVCDLVVKESIGVSLKKSDEDGTLTMFSSRCAARRRVRPRTGAAKPGMAAAKKCRICCNHSRRQA